MNSYILPHVSQLEHEAVFILREVVAQFDRPVLLFSAGKDFLVLVRLAQKAFLPARMPFPLQTQVRSDLLHLTTAGSVDDGISTLIGRMTGSFILLDEFTPGTVAAGMIM